MGFGVLVITALGLAALLAGFTLRVRRTGGEGSERAVLPSHYSSLLNADREFYPGHCTSCGTDNEPGYRFCERCGSEIPSSGTVSTNTDVRWIFNE